MKLYPKKDSRVMDPKTMRALDEDGTKVNPKGFETYWHRQKLAGDVFESKESRDEAAAKLEGDIKAGADSLSKGRAAVKAKKNKAAEKPAKKSAVKKTGDK